MGIPGDEEVAKVSPFLFTEIVVGVLRIEEAHARQLMIAFQSLGWCQAEDDIMHAT